MRTMKYVTLATLAAAGLTLAGCGGGSKKPVAMGNQQMEMTDAQKAQAAYDAAAAAEKAAMAAEQVAKMQRDAAKKASPTERIYSTGGDSSMVRANAEAIKAAKAAAEKALADARAEKMKIDEALKALNALPAGQTGLAAQKKVVDQQSKDVAAQIKLIEGYLTGAGSIAAYLSSVDTEAKIKNRAGETPAGALQSSTRPARRMLFALEPADTARAGGGYLGVSMTQYPLRPGPTANAGGVSFTVSETPPTKVVAATPASVSESDSVGRSMFYHRYDVGELPAGVMTWEQIAAKDGMLVKKAFGADNMDVDVLPLAGMPLTVLTTSSGTALTELPEFTSGMFADQYYKGQIKGTLYCQGTCSVEGGKLTGNLFFKWAGENNVSRYYWITPRNSHYTEWAAYVRYGYWLYETTNTTGITLLAHSPAIYEGYIAASTTLPNTATYKGKALGLSVLKLFTAGEHTGQKSAQFTADVTLNAKFGAAPKLGGTIDKFMGNAVDEKWSVKLVEAATSFHEPTGTGGNVDSGLATGSSGASAHDKSGEWAVKPFSQNGVGRPTGFLGTFNTHFPNGHAAGAFSTRIQTETTE